MATNLNIPMVKVSFQTKTKDTIEIKPEHVLRFKFLKSGSKYCKAMEEYDFELDLPKKDYQDIFDVDDPLHLSKLNINGICLSGVAIRKTRFSSSTEKEWVFVKNNTQYPELRIMTTKDDIITIWGVFRETNWMDLD